MIRKYTFLFLKLAALSGLVLGIALALSAVSSALSPDSPCPGSWSEQAPPAASFSVAPSAPLTHVLVSFDASSSISGTRSAWTYTAGGDRCEAGSAAQEDPIVQYRWAFGDGATQTSSTPTASHIYVASGRYTVTLTVRERNGHMVTNQPNSFTGTVIQQVTVGNRLTAPSFSGPASVVTGHVATFHASTSRAPDGRVISYHWDFGDGQTRDTTDPTIAHVYTTAGVKIVTLTVSDKDGATSQSQHTINAVSPPPVASFSAPARSDTGQATIFNASASVYPDGTIVAYHWVFGDGSSVDTTSPTTAHIYTAAGVKTVTLTVTDDDGTTGEAQRTVNVHTTSTTPKASMGQNGSNGRHAHGGVTVTKCVVPNLRADKLSKAKRALAKAGCKVGKVGHRHVNKRIKRGRVIAQSLDRRASCRPGLQSV